MITCRIIELPKLRKSGEFFMVIVPAIDGDWAVMEGHAPYRVALSAGEVRCYSNEDTIDFAYKIPGGLMIVDQRVAEIYAFSSPHVESE